jgi:uridylate kinase
MTDALSPLVISLGGSILVPDGINQETILHIRQLVEYCKKVQRSLIIVVGGGAPARMYQEALRHAGINESEVLDWMGISATHMNAQFIAATLGYRTQAIVTSCDTFEFAGEPLVIAGGWKPGWSTDYVAVYLAKACGAQQVLNVSNIPYVYEQDPRVVPDAKYFTQLSWKEYSALIPEVWSPGLSSPFDPIASRFAETHGLEVIILSGKEITEIPKYLQTQIYQGTRIHP